jgi:hypothetical protein
MAPTANNSSCIFYDIGPGSNNSVACVAGSSPNCNSGTSNYGILVYPSGSSTPAWPTNAGYDLATGLGTVNAANLVNKWTSVSFTPASTTLTMSPPTGYTLTNIPHGQPVSFTVDVSPAATGDVSLVAPAGSSPSNSTGIGPFSLSSGTFSGLTNMLPGGTYGVTAHYAGNGTYGASDSTPVQVTVTPESSQTFVQLDTFVDCNFDITNGVTTIPYGYNIVCSNVFYPAYFLHVGVTNSSGIPCSPASSTGAPTVPIYQCPTGQAVVTDNGQPLVDLGAPASNTPGTYQLNSQGHFEDHFLQLPGGTQNVVATYSGNTSYTRSKSATDTITVTQAPTTITVTASPTAVLSGAQVTLTALVSTSSIGFAPTGAVHFLNVNVPMTGTVTYTPVNGSASGYASLTATLITSFTTTASITAQYNADLNYSASSTSSPTTVTVSSGAPDFSLLASPNSFIITAPGDSASTPVSMSPINNFTGTVSLSCSVPAAMTGASCTFLPFSNTLTPSNPSTSLTVTTAAPSTATALFNSPRWFLPVGGAILAAFFLLVIPTKRRRLKLAFGSLFLVLLAAAMVACGAGSSTVPTPVIPGTPTGTYTVTVTGTSGSLSHLVLVTVNVQ